MSERAGQQAVTMIIGDYMEKNNKIYDPADGEPREMIRNGSPPDVLTDDKNKLVDGSANGENGEKSEIADLATDIINRYGDSILQFACSYLHNLADAEDVLQETLICFLEKKPVFPDRKKEKSWLLKVTANQAKDLLRRRKVREADELFDNVAAECADDLSYVWEAVGKLPLPCREIFYLYYYEGYSTAEIADILGMKASTVRSHLKKGRNRLREILRKDYFG